MNKAVIYTSLTGSYDALPQYTVLDPDFDYVCFTNDYPAGTRVGQWEIRPIPIDIDDNTRLSRYVKLMPHTVFSDYEYSVWLDANLIITDQSIYGIIKEHIAAGELWCAIKHPLRDCIYEEAKVCVLVGKSTYKEIVPQMKFLKKKDFPRNFSLFENNVIIRRHNDVLIKQIDAEWWQIYLEFSKRDQLSLCYLFWCHKFMPSLLFPKDVNSRNIKGIEYIGHNKKRGTKQFTKILRYYFNRFRISYSSSF